MENVCTPFISKSRVRWEPRARLTSQPPSFHHPTPPSARGYERERDHATKDKRLTGPRSTWLPPHYQLSGARSIEHRCRGRVTGTATVILDDSIRSAYSFFYFVLLSAFRCFVLLSSYLSSLCSISSVIYRRFTRKSSSAVIFQFLFFFC